MEDNPFTSYRILFEGLEATWNIFHEAGNVIGDLFRMFGGDEE